MRTQTRKGLKIVLNPPQFVHQKQIDLGHEVYYIAYRKDGSSIELKEALPGMVYEIDSKPKTAPVQQPAIVQTTSSTLLKAEDCPSVDEGKWCSVKPMDPFIAEKYKGEQFYTHKSSPGLVIKSADGSIRHETKMSDMYKRRD